MTIQNAVTSFSARSVSFDADSMMLIIRVRKADAIKLVLTVEQYDAVSAVCVQYMRARNTVLSALYHARRSHNEIERKNAISQCIKDYEHMLNERMQRELKLLLDIK